MSHQQAIRRALPSHVYRMRYQALLRGVAEIVVLAGCVALYGGIFASLFAPLLLR